MTESHDLSHQFITLRTQLMSTLSCQCKWRGMPGLLDELHAMRQRIEATAVHDQTRRAPTLLTATRLRTSATLAPRSPQTMSW